MPPVITVFDISNYIIDYYFFQRLQFLCDCEQSETCFCDMKYEDFIKWNIKCFSEFKYEKQLWIEQLCKDIKNDKVCIMDEDFCVNFSSRNIFFDLNKSLVITCPR